MVKAKETPSLAFFGSFIVAKNLQFILVPNSVVLTNNEQILN
jgi:hypothetical protein